MQLLPTSYLFQTQQYIYVIANLSSSHLLLPSLCPCFIYMFIYLLLYYSIHFIYPPPYFQIIVTFLKIYSFILFVCFWLSWAFVAVHRLSLVVESGCYSSLLCVGFSLGWLSTGSRHVDCRAWPQKLRCRGSVALRHVKSSQTRD